MPASNLKKIIVPAAERITQAIDDCKFPCQSKYSIYQKIDDCHSYSNKNRYTNLAAIRVVK